MNEPLFTVTEQPASTADSSEESLKEEQPNPSAPRSRKKGTVELNPPNIHIEPAPPTANKVTCFQKSVPDMFTIYPLHPIM